MGEGHEIRQAVERERGDLGRFVPRQRPAFTEQRVFGAAPDAFDGDAFWAFTAERLPAYAAPVYVRIVRQADVTTTFKLRKIDLQRDGYDPARVSDPLYVRDDAARTYVRIAKE